MPCCFGAGHDPKIICHDVVVLFSDLLWSGLAGHTFLLGRPVHGCQLKKACNRSVKFVRQNACGWKDPRFR